MFEKSTRFNRKGDKMHSKVEGMAKVGDSVRFVP